MTDDGFKLFTKVFKQKKKNKKAGNKSKERSQQIELNSDESNNLSSKEIWTESDCVEAFDDKENLHLSNDGVHKTLGECNPNHLLYILKMILSFHA